MRTSEQQAVEKTARRPKIVVRRSESYLSLDDGAGGNPERRITRERVIFRGSLKAFDIWRKAHQVTERDRAEFVKAEGA